MNRYVSSVFFSFRPLIGRLRGHVTYSTRNDAHGNVSRFEQGVVRMCVRHIFNKFLRFTCTNLHFQIIFL